MKHLLNAIFFPFTVLFQELGRKRNEKEEEVGSDFEPWSSKRGEILSRFTTTEKLSIVGAALYNSHSSCQSLHLTDENLTFISLTESLHGLRQKWVHRKVRSSIKSPLIVFTYVTYLKNNWGSVTDIHFTCFNQFIVIIIIILLLLLLYFIMLQFILLYIGLFYI